MSVTFTKLFSSITESTIWAEPHGVRIVWITMLAMADRHGRVWASVPGLANRARVTLEECEKALETFQKPDKYSRTADFEGRRIEKIDGGWRLLNHGKYRAIRDQEAALEAKRKYATKKRAEKKAPEVEKVDQSRTEANTVESSRDNAEADAESDTDSEETTNDLFAGTPSGEKKAKAPRARNQTLENLISVCGGDPKQTTQKAFKAAATALKEIREVCPNVTRDQMQERAAIYRKKYTMADLTPNALAKYWGSLLVNVSETKETLEAKMRAHRGNPNHVEHVSACGQELIEFKEMLAKWKAMQ